MDLTRWQNWLQDWWQERTAGLNPLARGVLTVGAALVAALLLVQLVRFAFADRSTDPAELGALTFYAEQVHNAATFSMSNPAAGPIPTGDCLAGYTVGGATVTPAAETARLMKACEVSLDNNVRPVVEVTHRDGTVLSVP